MLHHQPAPATKYHPSSLSQFLAMHHQHQQQQQNQHHNRPTSPLISPMDDMDASSTHLESSAFGGNIGKSFTIAAILGLKKNAAAAAAAVALEHHHHQYQHPNHHPQHHHHHPFNGLASSNGGSRGNYSAVMNLSINHHQSNTANANNNNNNSLSNQNHPARMPAVLEKHLSHSHQMHHHQPQQPQNNLQSATSALQSLQQLQQAHHHQHGSTNAFSGRERCKNGEFSFFFFNFVLIYSIYTSNSPIVEPNAPQTKPKSPKGMS